MEANEMLDVIHYFFEDDLVAASGEQAEAKSETRSVVYRTLYGTRYKYALSKSGGNTYSDGSNLPDDGYFGDLDPFDPSENNVRKQFVPASEFDADSPLPFGRVLDAPLG
jgi:hypothetical protein